MSTVVFIVIWKSDLNDGFGSCAGIQQLVAKG